MRALILLTRLKDDVSGMSALLVRQNAGLATEETKPQTWKYTLGKKSRCNAYFASRSEWLCPLSSFAKIRDLASPTDITYKQRRILCLRIPAVLRSQKRKCNSSPPPLWTWSWHNAASEPPGPLSRKGCCITIGVLLGPPFADRFSV